MKKIFFVIPVFLFLAAILSSCDKKTDDTDNTEKFSTLSVEANKAVVENAGIDFLHSMDRMKSIETVGVIVNLGNILSSSGAKGFLFSKDSKLFTTLETFAAAAKGEKKLNDVFDAMVSSKGLNEDPQSIQEFWNDNRGTYTWNKVNSDWDKVLGGTTIIFKFPSSDVSATNDATMTVSNYTGVNISNTVYGDYNGDLPAALTADLKVGSKALITFTFAASYNTDGIPNSIAADLTIESFKFEVDLINNKTLVSVNYKFLENTTVIMDLGASGEGLFTEANYNANTTTTTHTENNGYWDNIWISTPPPGHYNQVWVPNTYTWEETNTDFEEIINSSSAHFQLFNVAIKGDVNIKGLVDQLKLIDKDRDNKVITDQTADNQYAAKINEFANLRLVNVINNQIMAKAEAYVANKIENQTVHTEVDLRLTFGDGSPIDVETYFDNGFNSFVSELNGLITDINSEYDLEIDPVQY
jgi:hypothetical protein